MGVSFAWCLNCYKTRQVIIWVLISWGCEDLIIILFPRADWPCILHDHSQSHYWECITIYIQVGPILVLFIYKPKFTIAKAYVTFNTWKIYFKLQIDTIEWWAMNFRSKFWSNPCINMGIRSKHPSWYTYWNPLLSFSNKATLSYCVWHWHAIKWIHQLPSSGSFVRLLAPITCKAIEL